jgi:hypothetical protein
MIVCVFLFILYTSNACLLKYGMVISKLVNVKLILIKLLTERCHFDYS